MKTLVCTTPHEFEMKETERPLRKEGEAILKVRRIGVCGTDYHAYHGEQPYFEYPRILGHEIVGEVEEIAEGENLKSGDLVTVIPYISCGHCIACRNSKPNACEELKVVGCHVDGSMREYISLPVEQLVSAKGLTLDQTVIIEPMAIGLHGVNRAAPKAGDWVLVLGAGPIGLACMKFAKLAGARVIAVDVNAQRLRFAQSWADVDHFIDASAGQTIEEVRRITDGDLATSVIDCTGNAKAMMGAFELAAHGGTVVYVSLVLADITFSDPLFHKKELTLKGSRAATKDEFAHVIESLRDGNIDASAFISHRAPFDDAIPSFLKWIEPGSGVIKAIIEF